MRDRPRMIVADCGKLVQWSWKAVVGVYNRIPAATASQTPDPGPHGVVDCAAHSEIPFVSRPGESTSWPPSSPCTTNGPPCTLYLSIVQTLDLGFGRDWSSQPLAVIFLPAVGSSLPWHGQLWRRTPTLMGHSQGWLGTAHGHAWQHSAKRKNTARGRAWQI